MLQTSKRNVKRVSLNKMKCPRRLSIKTIGVTLLFLVLFSFYLSTLIQTESSDRQYVLNKPIINPNPNLSKQSSNHNNIDNNESISPTSHLTPQQMETALHKSLNMYINRIGHNDRVEYLIGFKGERISNPSEYQTLQTRNTKQYDRDYRDAPIQIPQWIDVPSTETKCDALCIRCRSNCDIGGIKFSMENVAVREMNNYITGNTKLDSLVPVPYFSWHDFQFMSPIKDKTADSLAAAFISNCGFSKRNKMVRDLQINGVSVDSYGRCEHNKDEKRNVDGKRGSKIEILQRYKFSLAFENSETNDYISEKFFGTLQSGSVPVYIGAPNIKFFAPDFGILGPQKPWKSKAVIWAGNFDFDAQKLAKHLLYLDSNDTAYNEYLRYKIDGYSGDFKAMVDMTAATHTNCRQCILATDWSRYKNGIGKYDEVINRFETGSDIGKWFYIRERGMYRFTLVRIESNTLESLVRSILIAVKPKPVNFWTNNEHPNYDAIGPAVYAIYHIPTKHVIHSNAAIENIPEYAELEVILV